MLPDPIAVNVPLREDEHGVIRVSGTRVPLETIIWHHQMGESPEQIHAGFDVVPVADIYAVIAYYLANQETVDQYLQDVERKGEEIQQTIEAQRTPNNGHVLNT